MTHSAPKSGSKPARAASSTASATVSAAISTALKHALNRASNRASAALHGSINGLRLLGSAFTAFAQRQFHALRALCACYRFDQRGVTAVSFAVTLPLIIAAAGMAVDLSNAYLVKKRLAQALDAAALATAGSSGNEDALYDRLTRYIEKNYENGSYERPDTVTMTLSNDVLFASAETTAKTGFMRIFGKDSIPVYVETEVKREVRGVEVVLVLDNTSSMSTNNNIGTLRTAAQNFVTILFDAASTDEAVKIGLVPYSTSVNVGSYGLGRNPDNSYYDEPFVNNPHNRSYNPSNSSQWHGCVLAHSYPLDTEDHEGPWDMYRYCRDADNDSPVCDYRTRRGVITANNAPNYICPNAAVVPLTSNRAYLTNTISSMTADGWTLGNYGLSWGWRVISPEYPFQEAAAWDDREWKKVVIMMTDGVNTMHQYYTAYGPTADHNIRASDLNERMEETCEAMKDMDISVYTITFDSGVDANTKDFFRRCATTPDQYYDAPTQQQLISTFEQISRELSNLHISR